MSSKTQRRKRRPTAKRSEGGGGGGRGQQTQYVREIYETFFDGENSDGCGE